MKTFKISEQRACGLMDVWRSSCRYQQKADRNEALREQLVELKANGHGLDTGAWVCC